MPSVGHRFCFWGVPLGDLKLSLKSPSGISGNRLFELEAGVRVAQTPPHAAYTAFASEILKVGPSRFRMYFAAYSRLEHAAVMTAVSEDGLEWEVDPDPVISPSGEGVDAVVEFIITAGGLADQPSERTV